MTEPDHRGATEASDAVPAAPRPVPPVPSEGTWVGPVHEPALYERLEYVGGGFEGAVFKARFAGSGHDSTRMVALKEYRRPAGAARDWPHDGTLAHLDSQVGLLLGLTGNKHMVQVQKLFLGAVSPASSGAYQTPYLVMEWIDGTPPAVVLEQRKVSARERAGWVRDLARTIDLLHSATRTENNPIAHGDIKPGNCLITADRGLVLVDTGAITRLDSDASRRGLCTPRYAAPEVLAAPERPRAAASDLFSLGAVAFSFLVGEAPPSAEDPDYYDEVRSRLDGTNWGPASGTVRELIARYLSPDPADRTGLDPAAGVPSWRRPRPRSWRFWPVRRTRSGPTTRSGCSSCRPTRRTSPSSAGSGPTSPPRSMATP
ncbi:protein kinase [Actinoplanes sp. LDG1-06]|uniref:non-specific serine/threonine protein kinase n=1 Tax=Paractinoplanes ovalisporus TaxID=2810368 RepID=A0ABS2A7E2_9ACTN|nr:protein kinase [Actinoplanes ovalisporus]MBM2615746.1 protein kinase [Actinoplanes ovalisporus]